MAVTIRPRVPADIPPLLRLARSLPEWFNAEGLARMEGELAGQGGWVAEEEGRLLGFCAWTTTADAKVGEMTWLAVARDRHRNGVGTALCDALESVLRVRGLTAVEVSTLAETIAYPPYEGTRRFYAKRGYRPVRVDPAFWGPGNDRLLLRLEFASRPGPAPAPWTAERVVDPALAASLIESQFPALAPARVEPLGVGWDNTAYRVNGAWVFRFPRRQIAVPWIEREAQLLPRFAASLPLPVPVPEWIGRPEPRFPWPFSGYRFLPGRTACGAALTDAQRTAAAEPLGRFLAALHAIPCDQAAAWGAGPDEIRRMDVPFRSDRARTELLQLEKKGVIDRARRSALEAVLDAAPPAPPEPRVLLHGDLYIRHLLVDSEGRLTGVIDWGDIHLGHPAVDVSIAFIVLPPAARAAFLSAYGPIDDVTWRLARLRAVYHSVNVVRFAPEAGDSDLFREGLRALEWLAEA